MIHTRHILAALLVLTMAPGGGFAISFKKL